MANYNCLEMYLAFCLLPHLGTHEFNNYGIKNYIMVVILLTLKDSCGMYLDLLICLILLLMY